MSSTDPFGLIGQVLDGQFRVEKFVGEGGFSVVYRGYHVGLEEPIAIKCLKLPIALGSALVESFVKRFRDESRLHYRLSQGNLFIARTLAHGTTMAPATGALVPYMVLEWLEGKSLAADLEVRRAYGDKGRGLDESIAMLDSAVDGLAYAHAQGVVHRDVNPGNLFMTNTSQGPKLKVLDFGVAKVITDHALALGPRAQTIGQIRIFSPQYAAPEQFDDKLGEIGTWTDVYSMALILIELLQDKPAIEGEHLGDYASRSLDPLVRPSPRKLGIAVADETEAILASAVSLHPKDRPQDVGQFWGGLKAAMRRDVAAGNLAYAEPPRAHDRGPDTAGQPSSGHTLPNAMRVQPGRTLNIEKVPIPVRPSEPAPSELAPETPELPDLPPQTARMADAPVRERVVPRPTPKSGSGALAAVSPALPYPQGGFGAPMQYAPQRVTPAPAPIESLARPSLPLESAVPATPPATEVKVPSPPPPVPNAFEHAPGLRTGENPVFANPQGPSTLTGNATPYAIPATPLQSTPIAAAPMVPERPAAPPAPLPALMDTHPLAMSPMAQGTALMARPSPSATPPAAAPGPAYAASQPPNANPFAQTELPPDSDADKPTRIGAGALDVFTSLYTSPLDAPAPPPLPPMPPAPLYAPPVQRPATSTVTTRKRGGGFVAFVFFLVLAVLGAGAYGAYYYYRVRHGV